MSGRYVSRAKEADAHLPCKEPCPDTDAATLWRELPWLDTTLWVDDDMSRTKRPAERARKERDGVRREDLQHEARGEEARDGPDGSCDSGRSRASETLMPSSDRLFCSRSMGANVAGACVRTNSGRKMAEASAGRRRHSTGARAWK